MSQYIPIPPKVRFVLYLIGLLGGLVVTYLIAEGRMDKPGAALAAGVLAILNGLASTHVAKPATNEKPATNDEPNAPDRLADEPTSQSLAVVSSDLTPAPEPVEQPAPESEPTPDPAPATEPVEADPVKAQLKAAIEQVRANSNATNDARAAAAKAAVDASA